MKYLVEYELRQTFEVEVEADNEEIAKAKSKNYDFALAACERAADLTLSDFEYLGIEEDKS